MLKKAGFIVVAATAGLLAVSPLAFAGEYAGAHGGEQGNSGHHEGGHHEGGHHNDGHHNDGHHDDEESAAPAAAPMCSFDEANDNSVDQDASGVGGSLLGILGTAANTAIPANVQLQAPIGSCNTIETTDIEQDNDSETTTVERSFND